MINLRINKYLKQNEDFINVNYGVLPLITNKVIDWWELIWTNVFENYDHETKTWDVVVKETITYTRVSWYIQSRLKIIERYTKENEVWYTKKMLKYYSIAEATSAWEKNRKYKIDEVKWAVVMLIAQTEQVDIPTAEAMWGAFIMANQDNIWMYVGWVPTPLLTAITDSTLERMDNDIGWEITIRQYMINYLS